MTRSIEIGSLHSLASEGGLGARVPEEVKAVAETLGQKAIPSIAKDSILTDQIERAAQQIPTEHKIVTSDSRAALSQLGDNSVHLIVTSPPYWTLKEYVDAEGQLGFVDDYDDFLDQLDRASAAMPVTGTTTFRR